MQKPPETSGGSQRSSWSRVLDQDGGDDQDLAGNGDNACHAGFNDTHFNFPMIGEPFRSRDAYGDGNPHSQLQR
jgi:hypothetical protein